MERKVSRLLGSAPTPWDSNPKGNRVPYGAGKYTDNESGLRNKLPSDPTGGAVSRDIFDDVEGQSSDSGNRAVRSRGQP
jgi:hypothetical protein